MAVKLRKGAEAHFAFYPAKVGDSFTIPAGYRIRNVVVENGLAPIQNQNIQTFTVTAAATGTGTILIDGYAINVTSGDTIAIICAKIAAAGPFTGVTSGVAWSVIANSTTIVLYSPMSGTRSTYGSAITAVLGTATGTTFSAVTATVGGTPTFPGAPTLSFGSTQPIVPVQTFTVTGNTTTAGIITIDGVPIWVPTVGTTPAQLATIIVGASLYGATSLAWNASASVVNGVQTITLTGVAAKNAVGAVTLSAGSTGTTLSSATVVQAGALTTNFFTSNTIAIPTAGQGVTDFTSSAVAANLLNPWSSYDKVVFSLTVSGATAGTFQVNGNTVNLTSGNVATATALATALAAVFNGQKGYYATSSTGTLTVYTVPQANGYLNFTPTQTAAGTTVPAIAQGALGTPATGITWTQTTATHDITWYANFGAGSNYQTAWALNSTLVYVFTERMY